jgi:cell division protein FtsQ
MKTVATSALRSVPRVALALPVAWRRRIVFALAGAAFLAAAWFGWFRDSSFVRVEKVQVAGLSGPQSAVIRRAIVDAGLGMTTLHVRNADLQAAVTEYPVVRSVTAQGDFPHALHVRVELNLPVGVLKTASGRVPVAADGTVLRDVPASGGLPVLSTAAAAPPRRITEGKQLWLVTAVAAAPSEMRARVKQVLVRGNDGLVAVMRRGPDLIFGDAARIRAKWMAASRVLADASAKGATYLDLRVPERPAAGGLATTGVVPLAPAGQAPTGSPPTTTSPVGASAPPAAGGTTGTQNPQPQVQTQPQP